MSLRLPLLATTFSFFVVVISSSAIVQEKCGIDSEVEKNHEVFVYLNSKRNGTGIWHTTYVVHAEAMRNTSDDGIEMDLKQSMFKCGGKEFVQFRGVLVLDTNPKPKPLFFVKGGSNAEFSIDRRTITRKTGDSDGTKSSAITNRPLEDNELLEVKLDKVTKNWETKIMVGVTTHTPTDIKFSNHLLDIKSGTLVYHYESVYYNGTNIQANYGAKIHQLKVGDRIGVMRRGDGTVHFFVNGFDQGSVKMKITGVIYGVVDVYAGAVQATIVRPPYYNEFN